jgi:dTDP-4-dehydrorhamnose reductase
MVEFHILGQERMDKSMRILVTGARGMLGTDLCRELINQGFEVLATDIDNMDVRNPNQVELVFNEYHPDFVFHLAALTDVDYCELEPEEAFQTNTIGTQIISLACQKVAIPLTYVSTISVFDGTKPDSYTEFDIPNPQSWYSRSKYEGEKIVASLLQNYFIVRAGWMFGGGVKDKKFVAKIIELARSRSELKIVDDKLGSPTYTRDFSRALLMLQKSNLYGLYHAVNVGRPASRYEYAQKILEYAKINSCTLFPVSSDEFPLPAPRPRMEAARNLHAELLGMDIMRSWEDALSAYIQDTILVTEGN